MGGRMLVATICVGVVSCCALPLESELVLEVQADISSMVNREGSKPGSTWCQAQFYNSCIAPARGNLSVTVLSPGWGPFGYNFGAPWESFLVVILSPISVIKTTTENRLFDNNLL